VTSVHPAGDREKGTVAVDGNALMKITAVNGAC
jgi:hypothetical protein